MNFALAIPTYKRPEDLRKCLDSIIAQTLPPKEIWVIDDDQTSPEFLAEYKKKFADLGVDFFYYKKDHNKKEEAQGPSPSRDLAMKNSQCEVVFILDDDLVLDPDYCKYSMKAWEEEASPSLMGVGGLISNERDKSQVEIFYNKIFGLTSKYQWNVNQAGFQVWDQSIQKRTKGYYAHGGVCGYQRKLAEELKFNPFSGGRPGLADVEFALRAKNQGYYYIIEPLAKAAHYHRPGGRESEYQSGFKEGRNRKIIFKNNCPQKLGNKIFFLRAFCGWTLRAFLIGRFRKGLGMIVGLFAKI